jgi:hypothetical protein
MSNRINDRRLHGNGNNTGTTIAAKSNLQDQRKTGAYGPTPAATSSTSSEFAAGVAAGRPQGAGTTLGRAKSRTMSAPHKLGAS